MDEPTLTGAKRAIYGTIGFYIIIAAILSAVITLIAFMQFPKIADYLADFEVELPGVAVASIRYRHLLPLTALPALLGGIALLRMKSGRLPLMMFSVCLLALPLVITLWCFLSLLMPLYSIQDV